MKTAFDDELLAAVGELRELFPDWRLGQLLANLAQATNPEGNVWDIADEELLVAARRLIERNESRRAVPA